MVKVAVALAIFGLLGYDGFVTIAAHLKAQDDAQNAAYAASEFWNDNPANRDIRDVFNAAVQYEAANNPTDHVCEGASDPMCGSRGHFSIDADGTVHLVVRRTVNTLIFKHLGFMHSELTAYEDGDASLTS
ncbi:MAG TPA: hypothetical protein VHD81_01930 [Mycobacteriales bacterium]|nr:hypothetical protein [Mycobacteriales bacterium]